ncbi:MULTISPECIES: Uma2 family endonuclease [Streptomyces]|uniref:Uma2 family endonuclease n=1 Tax=Streptomyces TaxID=1883 RepID=UPI001E2B7D37|nr:MULTISPECIES: Uma2 family endonuclease [Streptomyces]UFQ17040.1 Uma2 family endonuclease [Streptomyces huasconensis]WCL86640.1 Uma2 family endonuclease [Streptomyces sp. JCM 35825]
MSAQPVEPSRPTVTYQQLGEYAEEIVAIAESRGDLVRADIANQEITVHMMSPSNAHCEIVLEIGFQVRNQDRDAVGRPEGRVHRPDLGLCRTADLLLLTREVRDREIEEFATLGPDVSVAVEVVSPSNPGNDHITKLRDYPRMGIPIYVIVDPRDGTITVHSGPDTSAGEPRYADTPRRYKFGDTVQLGPWSVETGDFRRYRD